MAADTNSEATPDTGRRSDSALGRKRDSSRTEVILDAAVALLLEFGADGVRVQDVAERAACGTGAIYRRWKTKEALLAEAIRAFPDPEAPRTNDALNDLRALVNVRFAAVIDQPDLLPSLIAAMRSDEGIADAIHDRYSFEPVRQAVERVLGDEHPMIDLLAEIAPALALHRSTFGRDDDQTRDLGAEILSIVSLVAHSADPT